MENKTDEASDDELSISESCYKSCNVFSSVIIPTIASDNQSVLRGDALKDRPSSCFQKFREDNELNSKCSAECTSYDKRHTLSVGLSDSIEVEKNEKRFLIYTSDDTSTQTVKDCCLNYGTFKCRGSIKCESSDKTETKIFDKNDENDIDMCCHEVPSEDCFKICAKKSNVNYSDRHTVLNEQCKGSETNENEFEISEAVSLCSGNFASSNLTSADCNLSKNCPAARSNYEAERNERKDSKVYESHSLLSGSSSEQSLLSVKSEIQISSKETTKKHKKSKKRERKNTEVEDEVSKILDELALNFSVKDTPSHTKNVLKNNGSRPCDNSTSGSGKPASKKSRNKNDSERSLEVKISNQCVSDEITVEKVCPTQTADSKKKDKVPKTKVNHKNTSDLEKTKSEQKEMAAETVSDSFPLTVPFSVVGEEKDSVDKKKAKKAGSKEIKDRKHPGRKQIVAMQEAIRKIQEEEERLRLEAEAKQKKAEEEERLRQEKLILEQEKKERKKQKLKEKKQRLKAEGKILSKAQKFSLARMEATLAALRQQGIDVPCIGGKKATETHTCKTMSNSESFNPENGSVAEAPLSVVSETALKCGLEINSQELEGYCTYSEAAEMKNSANTQNCNEDFKFDCKSFSGRNSSKKFLRMNSSGSDSGSGKDKSVRSSTDASVVADKCSEVKKFSELHNLRSPVVCVLGHVDTGKTKILDKIRRSHVQDSEAGGITQQIGATMVPCEALKEKCKIVKNFSSFDLKLPGLLIIDTPGHDSFSNLRIRGSSLCDIAILVVDIMHGLQPQTVESINLLKQRKTPFVVALNKIDRLYAWKSFPVCDIEDVIIKQDVNTAMEFRDRFKEVVLQFAIQGLNVALFYENKDPRTYVSVVPVSAVSGDGMGNLLATVVQLTQTMMSKRLRMSEELQATVLEVKAISGLGTTIDVILVNGYLRESDTIVLAGQDGPIVSHIRSLLMPQPLKELRVKNIYQEFKEVRGAQGVKICAKDLEKVIAGLPLFVARHKDEVEELKKEVVTLFSDAMNSIKLSERGVYVHSSTLGSLEAFLSFLKASGIPYAGIKVGPVVKKDVMKASVMLEHNALYAVILAFDVKVEKEAQELADAQGVKIFHADIIYNLFDEYIAFRDEKFKNREDIKHLAIFPCKLRIIPHYVFHEKNPLVTGVVVEDGTLKSGTPICAPSRSLLDIGTVTSIELDGKKLPFARKGEEVCVKVEYNGDDAPKYGRHFDHTDILVSKISKQSIDICKEYYSDDLQKSDWLLMTELKDLLQDFW